VDNLGSQKELEVIHSHLFEILGHIFQKHRSSADSPRHIRAGLSRGFITQRCRPVAQQPPASPGNAVNQA
jgi:hypothetical protein